MTIVGIESSCDETSIGIVKNKNIVANLIASQDDIHATFGGVVPELASRAHLERIIPMFNQCLKEAKINLSQIDAFGVVNRPGLKGSLMVGVSFTEGIGYTLKKPVYNINHLHAHISACYTDINIQFPALGLVVSGGHTTLFLIKDFTDFTTLGETRDDACGEVFDKVGRMMNLPFPGGGYVEKLARKGDETKIRFPRAYIKNSLDFSFSGIKTAVYYYISKHGLKNKSDIAAGFQRAIVDSIIRKIDDALNVHRVKSMLFGGGVVRNNYLREKIQQYLSKKGIYVSIPEEKLCMDNGAMSAILTEYMIYAGINPQPYIIDVQPTK